MSGRERDVSALVHGEPMSKQRDSKSLGTILSVWAHPDDETYLAGGVMAAASDRGRPGRLRVGDRRRAGHG